MGRPCPDPILLKLQNGTQADYDLYLSKTWGYAVDAPHSDKEVGEHRFVNHKFGRTMRLQEIEEMRAKAAPPIRAETDAPTGDQRETKRREAMADETIQLSAAWKQYVEDLDTFVKLTGWTEAKHEAFKQLVLGWARAGDPPPSHREAKREGFKRLVWESARAWGYELPPLELLLADDGWSTAVACCARGEARDVEIDFHVINRRELLIEIIYRDLSRPTRVISGKAGKNIEVVCMNTIASTLIRP